MKKKKPEAWEKEIELGKACLTAKDTKAYANYHFAKALCLCVEAKGL